MVRSQGGVDVGEVKKIVVNRGYVAIYIPRYAAVLLYIVQAKGRPSAGRAL